MLAFANKGTSRVGRTSLASPRDEVSKLAFYRQAVGRGPTAGLGLGPSEPLGASAGVGVGVVASPSRPAPVVREFL